MTPARAQLRHVEAVSVRRVGPAGRAETEPRRAESWLCRGVGAARGRLKRRGVPARGGRMMTHRIPAGGGGRGAVSSGSGGRRWKGIVFTEPARRTRLATHPVPPRLSPTLLRPGQSSTTDGRHWLPLTSSLPAAGQPDVTGIIRLVVVRDGHLGRVISLSGGRFRWH